MNNALVYLGGLLVMALAVLFAVPYFVDWNSYRGVFEEEASRVLGREVRVGGAVNLRLLPSPFVRFEKLRIADLGGEGGTSIFRADGFTMYLSVPPLLRGVLEANEVELKRPSIQLAIDSSGAGNWASLKVTPGILPLLPRNVALQSVKLTDGTLTVSGPNRTELVRLENINGELVAEALEGPFKFKGSLSWGDAIKYVRLGTARADPNGDLRFKVAVDASNSGNSYLLDGKLSDIKGKPRIEGNLEAKVALGPENHAEGGAAKPLPVHHETTEQSAPVSPQSEHAQNAPQAKAQDAGPVAIPGAPAPRAEPPAPGKEPPRFDVRAQVTGDITGFKLPDITLTLDQEGPPQLITGTAAVTLGSRMRFDVELASKWLDLDRIVGVEGGTAPLGAARGFFETFAAALPAEADTKATLEFDQLNLGGEAVSDVRLSAMRTGGPLELKDLRASFPGGTRLDLDGVLSTGQKVPRLDGKLALTGQSLVRFLSWGFRNKTLGDGRSDGPFSLEGRLALSENAIEITEANADINGTPLTGEVKVDFGARRKFVVAIEGAKVDAGQLHAGILSAREVVAMFAGAAREASDPGAGPQKDATGGGLDLADTDLSVKLDVAEMSDGPRVLKGLAAEIAVDRGRLSMPVLRFATPQGLKVDLEGSATGVPEKPVGVIRGLVDAPSHEAALALIDLFDFSDAAPGSAGRFAALAPVRLAGTLAFGGEKDALAELSVDGSVQDGRLIATVRAGGGRTEWRSAPVDLTVTMDGQGVGRLLSAMLALPATQQQAAGGARAQRLVVKAAGIPEQGVLALASVDTDGLSGEYDGRIALPAGRPHEIAGQARISSGEAGTLLGLAGLGIGEGARTVPMSGTVTVDAKDGILTLGTQDLAVGAAKLGGTATIVSAEDKPKAVVADLTVSEASFAGMMAPLLGRSSDPLAELQPPAPQPASKTGAAASGNRGAPPPPAPVAAPADVPVWPEAAFDLAPLADISGQVTVRFGQLALEPGLSMTNARLVASLGASGITAATLEGEALGGKVASNFSLDKEAAGISTRGNLRIDISSGTQATEEGAPAAPGDVAAFAVEFSGRALSPAALISDLVGKGDISVGDATLTGMTPAAVKGVAEAALSGKGPASGDALVQVVRKELKEGNLKLGKLGIPIEIKDGAMKLEKMKIEMEEGRSTFATAIELGTMKIDSEWQIEPKVARASAPAERVLLPPVGVVYVGKLRDLASLEPTISTGALERELAVRKMERDVDELERLRKNDQIRARQELDRQKALDAERMRQQGQSPGLQQSPPPAPSGQNIPGQGAGTADPADATMPAVNASGEPNGAPAAEASAPPPPARRRNKTPDDAWRPFQVVPY